MKDPLLPLKNKKYEMCVNIFFASCPPLNTCQESPQQDTVLSPRLPLKYI